VRASPLRIFQAGVDAKWAGRPGVYHLGNDAPFEPRTRLSNPRERKLKIARRGMALSPEEANEIASRYPVVGRNRVSELQVICDRLNRDHPEAHWAVEQCRFDAPDDEVEFSILPWFDVPDEKPKR
jgi:hypothetical protein